MMGPDFSKANSGKDQRDPAGVWTPASSLCTETLILARLTYCLPPLGKTEIEQGVVRSEGVRNLGGQRKEEPSALKT